MVPMKEGDSVDLLTWATRNGHSEVEQFLTEEGAQIAETPQPAPEELPKEEEGGQEEGVEAEAETEAKEEGKEEDAREEGDGAEDTTEAVEGAGDEEPPAVSSGNFSFRCHPPESRERAFTVLMCIVIHLYPMHSKL